MAEPIRRAAPRRCRGSLLVASLGVVIFLTLAGTSLMVNGVSESSVSARMYHRANALQLAEAGLNQAALNLKTPDAGDDLMEQALPSGEFEIETQAALPSGNSMYEIISRGTSQLETRRLRTYYRVVYQSVFQFAAFGDHGVGLSGEIRTDSYNSDLGLYDPVNHGHAGDVGTNNVTAGGITIDGTSLLVDGQVSIGPDVADPVSLVTGYTPGVITGGTDPPSNGQDVTTLDTVIPMPPVVVPVGLPCAPQQVKGGDPDLVLTPIGGPLGNGTYCYSSLDVAAGRKVIVTGSVKVYLTGPFTIVGSTTVGEPTEPSWLTFYVSAGVIGTIDGQMGGESTFYGAIYAPDADIAIGGDAQIFGSIVGEDIYVAGDVQLHYDEAMGTRTDGPSFGTTTLTGWEEL